MSLIDRTFRLADKPDRSGLSCTTEGVSLAGIPLLRMTPSGLAPKPVEQLGPLMKSAYGPGFEPAKLIPGLQVVADALNQRDLGRAMIAALRLQLPDVDQASAVRLTKRHASLSKFNPEEPRDARGRWTLDGGPGAGDGGSGPTDTTDDSLKPIPAAFRGLPNDFDDNCINAGRNCVVNSLNGSNKSMFSACQKAQTVCHVALIASKFSPDTEFIVLFPDRTVVGIADGESYFKYINGIRIPKSR